MNSPSVRKLIVTLATVVAAVGVFLVVVNSGRNRPTPAQQPKPAAATDATPQTDAVERDAAPADATTSAPESGASSAPPPPPATVAPPVGLSARAPQGGFDATRRPTPIGSLDPRVHPFRIEFTGTAAGVRSIVFSDFWRTASERNQARRHWNAVAKGNEPPPLPADSERYELTRADLLYEGGRTFEIPVLAVHSLEVDGASVSLFGNVWSERAPGVFTSEIVDADGAVRLRLERAYELAPNSYDLAIRQKVENVGAAPTSIRWIQFGPSDLSGDPTTYIDVRRFHAGFLMSPTRDPDQATVLATGQMQEHGSVVSRIGKGQFVLWPNDEARANDLRLSWFGSTSRYFALCAHADWHPDRAGTTKAIAPSVAEVRVRTNGGAGTDQRVLSELHSAAQTIAPGASASFDLGLYAGPLDPEILGGAQPYAGLGMRQLIVYVLSSCCTFCTFAWLANLLAGFLSLLHDYVVFDWGLAIVVLVIVVRLLLHPLMKRSQIQMQRFGRKMAELKPELDALTKRYKDEPQKLQAEQMRLYREKQINPVGCVGGMLPTFLQMPIWIALYAVLFFNWDLRQAPAFFGVFQLLGGWQFLGDLSRPDSFVSFPRSFDLWLFTLSGINVLPILMGVVFWFQQKYMTPPMPNMTPEQAQQQKMMKWMMVILFPLMLYPAPSGLTLYILTSTCIGIWESRLVKRHIDTHGLADPKKDAAGGKKKRDWMGRMYEEALERARRKQEEKNRKTFKERGK